MSHYSKEVAKIRAEKNRQKEIIKEQNLQSEYAKRIKEIEEKISAMSPEERIEFAHKISNELRLNEAKLKDNKEALNKADNNNTLDAFSNILASSILCGALGATTSLSTGGDGTGLALFMATCGSAISCGLELALLDTKYQFRPISKIKRNKAEKNIENLERESDALDEIKDHLNETYGIKVKVPVSRLLGLDREM